MNIKVRRRNRGLFVATYGFIVVLILSTASASEVNICVNVLEDIINPVNEYRCGSIAKFPPDAVCLINPLCCTPQVCKITPECGLAQTVIKTIAKKGDVHCFKDISGEKLWQRWKEKQIAFIIPMIVPPIPPGLTEALLPFVKADISIIAQLGNHLPEHLQELLKEIIVPIYDHGNTGFGYEDIHNIKIINESYNFNTKLWVTKGAITLGPVVILKDNIYEQLMDSANNYSLTELRIGNGTQGFTEALAVIVHELVHVKQYKVLGQDTFIINYVLNNIPRLTKGYGHGPYEKEAYNFEADILELHGGHLCERTSEREKVFNRVFNLGRPPIECKPFIAWMIPLLR